MNLQPKLNWYLPWTNGKIILQFCRPISQKMCLVAFFSCLSSLLNFCKTSFPHHDQTIVDFSLCWRRKITALVHTARFKTRALLPPSPLCRPVVNLCVSQDCHEHSEALCKWFSSCLLCIISFFSLFDSWFWVDPFHQDFHTYTTFSSLSHYDTWKAYMESFLLYLPFKSFS